MPEHPRTIIRKIVRKLEAPETLEPEDFSEIIGEIKYDLTPEQSARVLDTINPELVDELLGNPIPLSYKDLRKSGGHKYTKSLYNELGWYTSAILRFSKEINQFLDLQQRFEIHFLNGEYTEAEKVLDDLDNTVCWSLWSIEKRLLLAEYGTADGTGREKIFKFIEKDVERLVRINLSYYSTRVDRNLPTYRYALILDKFLERQGKNVINDYFKFRLNTFDNVICQHPDVTLYLDSNLSIIDRYQTFIRVVTSMLCSSKKRELEYKIVKEQVLRLVSNIDDPVLRNIGVVSGLKVDGIDSDTRSYLDLLNYYYAENYSAAKEICIRLLNANPTLMDVADRLVKISIVTGELHPPRIGDFDSMLNHILLSLYEVHTKGTGYNSALYSLTKIAKSISGPSWCAYLMNLVNSENSSSNESYNFEGHAHINSGFLHPQLVSFFNENTLEHFISAYKNEGYNSDVVFYNYQKGCEAHFIPSETNGFFDLLHRLRGATIRKENFTAMEILTQLERSPDFSSLGHIAFIKQNLVKLKVEVLFQNNEKIAAMEFLCYSVLENQHFTAVLHNHKLVDKILTSDKPEIFGNICTPILAKLYRLRVYDNWIAYDNFMSEQNLRYPREIIESDKFADVFKNFFLKYICIKDIYDSSPVFRNPEQLDNERIQICNYLTTIDPLNKELYKVEIMEIEKNLLIQKGIKQVDESKIFVDTAGITNELENEIRERFARGQELLKLSPDQINQLLELSSSVVYFFYENKEHKKGAIRYRLFESSYGISNQAHFETFQDSFLLIRDRFISSNEFGIDSYISMRIRHGTLLGQIRSVFEKHQLITKKSEHSKQYIPNEYWLSRLCQGTNNRDLISNKLNTFSEHIDKMSEEIKNSFLQVRTEDKQGNGLFDYSFSEDELVELYKEKFQSLENYTDFFNKSFEVLWQRTESNMNFIREMFSEKFSGQTIEALDELYSGIENLLKKHDPTRDVSEFARDITACKSDVNHDFNKIAMWFRRSHSNSINEFNLDLLLRTSLSIINKIHPRTPILNAVVKIENEILLDGQWFTPLIDIMRNVLDNIITHSELSEPTLKISINVEYKSGLLRIATINNISDQIDLDERNRKIAGTRKRLDRMINDEMVKKEGGSGYPKVKKIIKSTLKCNRYEIDLLDIDAQRNFASVLSFSVENLKKMA